MTDSSTPAVQPRVLDDPLLPDATDPVVGGDFGIPKRIYDEAPRGCKVVVDALVGQVGGERISLNLNGLEDLDSGYTQGPHDSVELHLPPGFLLHNAVNRLTYTVASRGGAPETSTPPLELLYNLIRPGNVDRSPGEPGHSELVLLLPDEIKNGVGPGFTRATVCVSYPYCRAYDTIRLNCNGKELTRGVLETEAPEPPNHGSPTPTTICFDVTSADLGADHPEFVFSFTVTDQLGNTPDLNSPYSAEQLVDVDQAGSRLPMPILREVLTDTGDDPSIIDLDKLGTNPLLFVVLTADPRILPGDSIEGTYVVRVAGQPNITVPVSGTVETDGFGQKQVCILEVPNDKVIAGSSVQASYRVFRGIPLVGSSRTAFATVIGQGAPDVEPVITRIEDSKGNEIPEGGITVDTLVKLTGTAR